MSLLEVQNLHAGYGTTQVLKGISFTCRKPQLIGILGANGCGKTTLLKNISGYYSPSCGHILIEKKDIRTMSIRERAKTIGYVPQDIPCDFSFRCYDLVMMGRTPYLKRFQTETGTDREIVREAMELTHTWSFRDRSATELSGGERQRVYIARSLAQKPRVLLLDEPISHLDIKYQVEILNLLQELAAKGLLVLAVLHDINLASQFCDQLLLMEKGTILAQGKSSEVIINNTIGQAFSLEVEIVENPLTNTPYVVPMVGQRRPKLKIV